MLSKENVSTTLGYASIVAWLFAQVSLSLLYSSQRPVLRSLKLVLAETRSRPFKTSADFPE